MIVPPSPDQPEETPGSIRWPTPLSEQGAVPGEGESCAEGGSTGRMIDNRRQREKAGKFTADGEESSGGGGVGRLPPTAVEADQEKPTPMSLSEAKLVRVSL